MYDIIFILNAAIEVLLFIKMFTRLTAYSNVLSGVFGTTFSFHNFAGASAYSQLEKFS